jgi:hypothetical protein
MSEISDKQPAIIPTIGRIVWYKMTSYEATEINQRRRDAIEKAAWHSAIRSGAQVHRGNEAKAGSLYGAMIVAVWGDQPDSCVNLQVFLDGSDTHWATSRKCGEREGDYQWMPYQKGQAAKTEVAEKTAFELGAAARAAGPAEKY